MEPGGLPTGAHGWLRGIEWAMTRFSTAVSRSLEAHVAAEQLADLIDDELEGPASVVGGLVLATEAAGEGIVEVGRGLAQRWPGAALFGTSFEGILVDGRIYRDEPAFAVLAWSEGQFEPVPLVFEPGEQDAARLAQEILDAAGRSELTSADLVLLFPDALGSPQLERVLAEVGPLLGQTCLAGAAATGLDGHAAPSFFGDEVHPGALLGLFVPGARDVGARQRPLLRCAGASRSASPWLEITECRARWVDGLEGEPPLDWVRRQLGLEKGAPVESQLDRLLVRVRRDATLGVGTTGLPPYEESYVIGVDDRRGSISLPGTFRRGDELALALPDSERARETLRASIDELAETPLMLQFTCRARDKSLYGDPDLESAWTAHHASDRRILGTVSPFQLAMSDGGAPRLMVHSTVLTALGE
jgi:small ligand-binding sensory domain FIST